MAVKGGARNLGRDDIGEIAPGFAADMVGWRTDTIGFSGCSPDPVAALVFCAPSLGFVDLSIINGQVVVEDGVFTSLDLQVPVHFDRKACLHCCRLLLTCARQDVSQCQTGNGKPALVAPCISLLQTCVRQKPLVECAVLQGQALHSALAF